MSLKDFFRRKKKKHPEPLKKVKEKEKKPEMRGKKKEGSPRKKPAVREKRGSEAYRILKEPHISEKSTALAEKSQYVFKVYSSCNKKQIKKAVEDVYGVDVLNVNIAKTPSKKRRLGRIEGFKKGYKKAIVQIKKGQKIEVM